MVRAWNSKWIIVQPDGRTVMGRLFVTAGAACRAANELGIEAS